MRKTWLVLVWMAACCGVSALRGASEGLDNFDRLSDADRKAFEERFVREVWPLLERNGKDGCVGCHNGKIVSDLRFSGDAAKDFRMMLKKGFFIPGDKGSLHGRVIETDKKRLMPPPPRTRWKDEDVQLLHRFVLDLDKKQAK